MASKSKYKYYFDDFLLKGHTTVKLVWTPPKSTVDKQGIIAGSKFTILKGFIKTDLVIQISNAWGNITSVVDGFISSVIGDTQSTVTGLQDSANAISQFTNQILGFNPVSSLDIGGQVNSKLVKLSDYIKRFQGTDVNFPNNIDIILLADEVGVDPRIKARQMLKYIMGGFKKEDSDKASTSYNDANDRSGGKLEQAVTDRVSQDKSDYLKSGGSEAEWESKRMGYWERAKKSVVGAFTNAMGMISPPGDYEYDSSKDFRKPNESIDGTLTLVIGDPGDIVNTSSGSSIQTGLVIRNLLVDSAEMTISKTVTKQGIPLYVNIGLALSPSAFISAGHIHTMLGGDGSWDDYDLEQYKYRSQIALQEDSIAAYKRKYPGALTPDEADAKSHESDRKFRHVQENVLDAVKEIEGNLERTRIFVGMESGELFIVDSANQHTHLPYGNLISHEDVTALRNAGRLMSTDNAKYKMIKSQVYQKSRHGISRIPSGNTVEDGWKRGKSFPEVYQKYKGDLNKDRDVADTARKNMKSVQDEVIKNREQDFDQSS